MERRDHYRGYLKQRILIPLSVVIVLTFALFAVATHWYVSSAIQRDAEGVLNYAATRYQRNIIDEALKIEGFIELISRDDKLREALLTRDRERLLALSTPYYHYLNGRQRITHYYLTLPDRTNLLRVHNPPRYGDRIDRTTTLQAEQSGATSFGLELGPLGTFTLRVVKPWFHQGKLIGYIELGEEIDHLMDGLRHDLAIDLYLFIEKKSLQRNEWEEGMRMLGRASDWDYYPAHILISTAPQQAPLPDTLDQSLHNLTQQALHQLIDVTTPGHHFKAIFLPLQDVHAQQVGMMLLLTPTDHWIVQGQRIFATITIVLLLLGGAIFALFYRLSDSTEKRLEQSQRHLLEEMERNAELQIHHIEELQAHNQQLQESRNELQLSHARLEDAQHITHLGSWEWELNSGTLTCSKEVYRILGLAPSDIPLTYQQLLMAIPQKQRQPVAETIERAIKSGARYEIEHKIIRSDNVERVVRNVGEIFFDAAGKASRAAGTLQDITQHHQAQEEERRLLQLINNASNEIYILDPATLRIRQGNQTACQRLNYEKSTLEQTNYLDILIDIDRSRFDTLSAPLLLQQSNEVVFNAQHRCSDGSLYPVDVRLQYSEFDDHPQLIAIVLDTSERQEQLNALNHVALHDSLTGLPNRDLLTEELLREIARAKRDGSSVTLIQIDLNDFREINDTLGHDNGDQLLRKVANRLCNAVRDSDMVARVAGDEFYLLLPDSGIEECATLIRHLQDAMTPPYQLADYGLTIELSGGLAIFPEHAADMAQLLRHADIALTRAKNQRSGIEIYRPEFDPYSVRRLILNSHLRHAIERGEFSLHYQPKVTSQTRTIGEAEALLRWHHPQYGAIPPSEFIQLAEETGYIRQLTLWVIEETARQLASWSAQGYHLSISVNLSARNLLDPDLLKFIVETVDRYTIAPAQLAFEITESTVMRDPDFTLGILNDLDAMGHPIAIDDYGTGYSSLTYLRRLPARELKIDISFIRAMLDDDDSAIIVYSTINMAHHLGLKVTAEGVETSDQVELLTILDADLLQGYYFSKPIPSEQFITMLTHVSDSTWACDALSSKLATYSPFVP